MKKLNGWGLVLLLVVAALFGFMWSKTRNVEQSAVNRAEDEALEEISNRFRKPLIDFLNANRRLARAGDQVKELRDMPAYIKEWHLLENGIVEVDINPGWGITMRKIKLVPIVNPKRSTYLPAGRLPPEMRAINGNIEFLSDADIEQQLAINKDRISGFLKGTETAAHGKVWFVAGAGNVCDGDCLRDLPCINIRPLLCMSKPPSGLKSTGTEHRGADFERLTDADAICAEQFGPNWTVVQTWGHVSGQGYSELMPQREYWVHYAKSTFENCWGAPY